MEYIAYLHKDKNTDYGVSFPDFPGCITAGSSLGKRAAWPPKLSPSMLPACVKTETLFPSPQASTICAATLP